MRASPQRGKFFLRICIHINYYRLHQVLLHGSLSLVCVCACVTDSTKALFVKNVIVKID